MKIEKNHIQKKCCQVVSFLMVILFISTTIVQAFHAHDSGVNITQSDQDDISYAVEKCKICEFYIHKQTETIQSSYPQVLVTPLPMLITHNARYYIGNYKFTLQGFTNKGPPQQLS